MGGGWMGGAGMFGGVFFSIYNEAIFFTIKLTFPLYFFWARVYNDKRTTPPRRRVTTT
jgi:hypothetical protein